MPRRRRAPKPEAQASTRPAKKPRAWAARRKPATPSLATANDGREPTRERHDDEEREDAAKAAECDERGARRRRAESEAARRPTTRRRARREVEEIEHAARGPGESSDRARRSRASIRWPAYLREVQRHPLLTPEETHALAVKLRARRRTRAPPRSS